MKNLVYKNGSLCKERLNTKVFHKNRYTSKEGVHNNKFDLVLGDGAVRIAKLGKYYYIFEVKEDDDIECTVIRKGIFEISDNMKIDRDDIQYRITGDNILFVENGNRWVGLGINSEIKEEDCEILMNKICKYEVEA